jgi:hypothetical protein
MATIQASFANHGELFNSLLVVRRRRLEPSPWLPVVGISAGGAQPVGAFCLPPTTSRPRGAVYPRLLPTPNDRLLSCIYLRAAGRVETGQMA